MNLTPPVRSLIKLNRTTKTTVIAVPPTTKIRPPKKKILNICFPRGIRKKYKEFNQIVKPDGINLDYELDPLWAKSNLKDVVIQGGLDPKILLKSEEEMLLEATKYIQIFKDKPYVFNLGHGLLPETDPDRVRKLIEFYRKYK